MANLMALCLVFASMFAAEAWSQNPTEKHVTGIEEQRQEQPAQDVKGRAGRVVESVKEKIKEASNVGPNLGLGISGGGGITGDHHDQEEEAAAARPYVGRHIPRELICDELGNCVHRVARAINKARGEVSEKAHEAVVDLEREVKEAKGRVEDAFETAKETVASKAHDVKESAKAKTEESVKSLADKGKSIGKGVASEMSEKVEEAKEKVAEKGKNWVTNYAKSPDEMLVALLGVVNLLGFGMAYGTCFWVTFVSSYVLDRALSKQQFGLVQSRLRPVYYTTMASSIGLALFGHLMRQRKSLFVHSAVMLQAFNLIAAIVGVLVNLLCLEPVAKKAMFERMKIEKEEGRGRESVGTEEPGKADEQQQLVMDPSASEETTTSKAEDSDAVSDKPENPEQERTRSTLSETNNRLKTLNSCSSFLNILTLMVLSWHLVYLGRSLHVHVTC